MQIDQTDVHRMSGAEIREEFERVLKALPGKVSASPGLRLCERLYRSAQSDRRQTAFAIIALEALAGKYPNGLRFCELDFDFRGL